MKTFIEQILEDDRPIEDLEEFVDEFGNNPMDRYLGEAIGITEEENDRWGHIIFTQGYPEAIEALKPIVEKRRLEKEEQLGKVGVVLKKIRQAQNAIKKMIKDCEI